MRQASSPSEWGSLCPSENWRVHQDAKKLQPFIRGCEELGNEEIVPAIVDYTSLLPEIVGAKPDRLSFLGPLETVGQSHLHSLRNPLDTPEALTLILVFNSVRSLPSPTSGNHQSIAYF